MNAIATSEIIAVLVGELLSLQRSLAEQGMQFDLRKDLMAAFDRKATRMKDTDPVHLGAGFHKDYEVLRQIFWQLFDQNEQAARVLDAPQGNA